MRPPTSSIRSPGCRRTSQRARVATTRATPDARDLDARDLDTSDLDVADVSKISDGAGQDVKAPKDGQAPEGGEAGRQCSLRERLRRFPHRRLFNDPAAPVPGDPAMFFPGDGGTGTTTGGACVSEPADGSLYPYNWIRPRVLWTAPATQTAFEVRVRERAPARRTTTSSTRRTTTGPSTSRPGRRLRASWGGPRARSSARRSPSRCEVRALAAGLPPSATRCGSRSSSRDRQRLALVLDGRDVRRDVGDDAARLSRG